MKSSCQSSITKAIATYSTAPLTTSSTHFTSSTARQLSRTNGIIMKNATLSLSCTINSDKHSSCRASSTSKTIHNISGLTSSSSTTTKTSSNAAIVSQQWLLLHLNCTRWMNSSRVSLISTNLTSTKIGSTILFLFSTSKQMW